MKKIAILYICTGRYSIFWNEFYKSCEKFFLPNYKKTYHVFTDDPKLEYSNADNVKIIPQEKLGWPYDTLYRFKMFNSIVNELKSFDYIFFFNANSRLVKNVNPDIIEQGKSLIGAIHPCYYNKSKEEYIYDRNSTSTAYMSKEDGDNYYMGAFNGGKAEAFIKLIQTLTRNIEIDEEVNYIALWHDESHLNKYFWKHRKEVLALPSSFVYPEEYDLPFEKINVLRDKSKLGGHKYLRSKNKNILANIIKKVKSIFSHK